MSCISFTSTIAQVPQSSFLKRDTGRLTVKKSLVSFGSQKVIFPRLAIRCNALKAKCGNAQTETISRKSSPSVASPSISKQPLLMLDDGGSGFSGSEVPPFYRGDDGGGGYGGGRGGGGGLSGGFSWGAFWFFFFLMFLHYYLSKDKEREKRYKILTGRRKTISHYLQ